jgi:TPR repeat protein
MTIFSRPALVLLFLAFSAGALAAGGLPANFQTLARIAEQGDPDAQYFIGRHYFASLDDPETVAKARDWLTRSAHQDHAHAMLLLGRLLELTGGPGDQIKESLRWYARAAELGLAEAQLRLGNFYLRGLGGLTQDCGEALGWYQKALDRGTSVAEANIVWLLATCPDAAVRDGRRAVRMGMDIVYRQGRESASNLDNLAAAFAEVTDFRSAWETQADALKLLSPQHPDRADYQRRLELYQAHGQWRELPAVPDS